MNAVGTEALWMPDAVPPSRLYELGWEEAQASVNFVLFRPDPLPRGLRLERASVRPETPPRAGAGSLGWTIGNRAAHRCELVGCGVRIRLKQFLYDWAPPAWDHPSLCGGAARAFMVRGHIGWLGCDFRGFQAATVTLDRTTVEISVREGACEDDLLAELCRALVPVSDEARDRLLGIPFARLAYRSRHPDRTPAVPVGFWRHRRGPPDVPVEIHDRPPRGLPGSHIAPPARLGFRLGAVLVFGHPRSPQEVEYLYEDAADPGRTIRLLVSPAGIPGGVRCPPVLEGEPCSAERRELDGREIYHAYGDARYGPHEAVWHAGGCNVMLLAKPAPWTDRYWFERVLWDVARVD